MEFYTAARYYRPSGVGVQLIGIAPDIEVFERPGPEPRNRVVLRKRDALVCSLTLSTVTVVPGTLISSFSCRIGRGVDVARYSAVP